MVITDEEIEHDVLEAYRPLSSPDGVGNWTSLGAYSVVFRRRLGQREVWVETPVHHFSVTANAKKVDKGGKNQSYYYGDLGGLRWWFKGRSSAPRVRFGNTTEARGCSFVVSHCAAKLSFFQEFENEFCQVSEAGSTVSLETRYEHPSTPRRLTSLTISLELRTARTTAPRSPTTRPCSTRKRPARAKSTARSEPWRACWEVGDATIPRP